MEINAGWFMAACGIPAFAPQTELLRRFMGTYFWAGVLPGVVMYLVLDSCEFLA